MEIGLYFTFSLLMHDCPQSLRDYLQEFLIRESNKNIIGSIGHQRWKFLLALLIDKERLFNSSTNLQVVFYGQMRQHNLLSDLTNEIDKALKAYRGKPAPISNPVHSVGLFSAAMLERDELVNEGSHTMLTYN